MAYDPTGERVTLGANCAPWLRKLADHLDDSPELVAGRFDMGVWWSSTVSGECHTAGCAIGWGIQAGVTPPGLVLKRAPFQPEDCECSGCHAGTEAWVPVFNDGGVLDCAVNFGAIAEAYQIPDWLAGFLFDPDEYPFDRFRDPEMITPARVAERLRHVAAVLDDVADLTPELAVEMAHATLYPEPEPLPDLANISTREMLALQDW